MASSYAYFDKTRHFLVGRKSKPRHPGSNWDTYIYTNTNMNDDTKYKVKRKLTAGSHSNIRSSVVWDTAIIGTWTFIFCGKLISKVTQLWKVIHSYSPSTFWQILAKTYCFLFWGCRAVRHEDSFWNSWHRTRLGSTWKLEHFDENLSEKVK